MVISWRHRNNCRTIWINVISHTGQMCGFSLIVEFSGVWAVPPKYMYTFFWGTIWIVSHQSSPVGASGTLERINQSHGMSLRCLSCVWSLQPLKKRVQHVTACSVFGLASKCLFSYLLLGSIPYSASGCTSWFELSLALTWCLSGPFKMARLLPINGQRQNQRAFVSKEYETTMHQRKLQRRLSFLIFWFLVCWHRIILLIPYLLT